MRGREKINNDIYIYIYTKTMPSCMVVFISVFTFVLSFVKKVHVISFSIVKDSLSNVLYDVL